MALAVDSVADSTEGPHATEAKEEPGFTTRRRKRRRGGRRGEGKEAGASWCCERRSWSGEGPGDASEEEVVDTADNAREIRQRGSGGNKQALLLLAWCCERLFVLLPGPHVHLPRRVLRRLLGRISACGVDAVSPSPAPFSLAPSSLAPPGPSQQPTDMVLKLGAVDGEDGHGADGHGGLRSLFRALAVEGEPSGGAAHQSIGRLHHASTSSRTYNESRYGSVSVSATSTCIYERFYLSAPSVTRATRAPARVCARARRQRNRGLNRSHRGHLSRALSRTTNRDSISEQEQGRWHGAEADLS